MWNLHRKKAFYGLGSVYIASSTVTWYLFGLTGDISVYIISNKIKQLYKVTYISHILLHVLLHAISSTLNFIIYLHYLKEYNFGISGEGLVKFQLDGSGSFTKFWGRDRF